MAETSEPRDQKWAFNMKKGHIPIRQCIGCRTRRPAGEMIRLTAHEGAVVVGPLKRNERGRGCYVCPREECVNAAFKKGRLSKALRKNILVLPSKEGLLRGLEQKR